LQSASCRAADLWVQASLDQKQRSSSSSRKGLSSTEDGSMEPPQPRRFSGTWRQIRAPMKKW
jgi:hypothetical protein